MPATTHIGVCAGIRAVWVVVVTVGACGAQWPSRSRRNAKLARGAFEDRGANAVAIRIGRSIDCDAAEVARDSDIGAVVVTKGVTGVPCRAFTATISCIARNAGAHAIRS